MNEKERAKMQEVFNYLDDQQLNDIYELVTGIEAPEKERIAIEHYEDLEWSEFEEDMRSIMTPKDGDSFFSE